MARATPSKTWLVGDLLVAGFVAALALVSGLAAAHLPTSAFDPLGPGAVPLAVSGALLLLAGTLALGCFVRAREGIDPSNATVRPDYARLAVLLALLVAFVAALAGGVSFAVAVGLFLLTSAYAAAGPQNARPLLLAVWATAMAASLHLIFKVALSVDLP